MKRVQIFKESQARKDKEGFPEKLGTSFVHYVHGRGERARHCLVGEGRGNKEYRGSLGLANQGTFRSYLTGFQLLHSYVFKYVAPA